MKSILLVIGDAAEVLDTMYPCYRLKEAGYAVHVAAPEKRTYHLVQHDTHPDWDITIESPGYRLASDIAFRNVDPATYAGVVLSGGRAPEYIRYDPDLQRIVKAMNADQKPIASICHGIEILAITGIIKGRTITTVKKCRFDAEVVGATYVDREVVVDGNLVCSRTYHDNWSWMAEFVQLLAREPAAAKPQPT